MNRRQGAEQARQEGMALVVTLLFTGIVLMIVASTSATLVTGSRSGGVDERRSYQALLAAESGLNTLTVRLNQRLTTMPYTGNTQADLQAWLSGVNSSSEATAIPASLTFTSLSANHFTVEARGGMNGATKVALQDFQLTPAFLPPGLRARAALTSLPAINANGSAEITGRSGSGVITTLSAAASIPVGATTASVTAADTTGLLLKDYVVLGGQTFRIDGISGSQLQLSSVPGPVGKALSLAAGSTVTVLLNAAAQTAASVTDPMTQRVSNAADFTVGEKVTVGGYAATVQAVTASAGSTTPNELRLDWLAGQPPAITEGTPVLRDLTAMRSGGAIAVKSTTNALDNFQMDGQNDCTQSAGKAVTCEGAADPLLGSNSSDPFFTQQILGLSDAELDALVPLTFPDASGNFPPMVNAVRRIRAQDFDAAVKNTTSSGVLIVDGDINSNVNGKTTFNGLIYFRGNQGGKFNGNLTVNGAVAVRGGPIEGITTDDTITDITGNLTVNFDAVKLRQIMMNARGNQRLAEIQGSWRQR
ncbi:pilus assembly PilX N-terminal domain-containing protein [Deinococcus taeanensis]|uniref:pilus assembly PilX N-terminal domain-containing protein n=1 Tax=Deinococcus taeanensis TaxID=2737050 RepID=UPI001CDC4A63|nr:pilus assembly PilX N-terminal domain-containing protein [Deinococcus taeanensis]UBV42067.1 pilus assembly PilX N-terminal domain-containing protein [Deinococcus taeanensis]